MTDDIEFSTYPATPTDPGTEELTTAVATVNPALPTEFIDYAKNPRPEDPPLATYHSTIVALGKLGLRGRYNVFRDEFLLGSDTIILNDSGVLSDHACLVLRKIIREQFGFEPKATDMQHAAEFYCLANSFHPIKEYLGSVTWDGTPRVDRLLCDYFAAKDTPLNAAISRIIMMASVRRIYRPGTKFDYMTVLQSPEGFNKSSAIAALYGEDYFTDQSTIPLNAKEVEETLRGMWAQESPELSGLDKADWNRLKASLSRGNDRIRRAYGRNPVNSPRTVIQWATSNDDTYLRALSGENRRFFSVDVLGMIDVEKIMADRDQLWAEAVALERSGESVMLPEQFWADARAERLARTEEDPWTDVFKHIGSKARREVGEAKKLGKVFEHYERAGTEERISSQFLLASLGFNPTQLQPHHSSRIARVMKSLGWQLPKGGVRIHGKNMRGFIRDNSADDLM